MNPVAINFETDGVCLKFLEYINVITNPEISPQNKGQIMCIKVLYHNILYVRIIRVFFSPLIIYLYRPCLFK